MEEDKVGLKGVRERRCVSQDRKMKNRYRLERSEAKERWLSVLWGKEG